MNYKDVELYQFTNKYKDFAEMWQKGDKLL
jgi:hypothetical protein